MGLFLHNYFLCDGCHALRSVLSGGATHGTTGYVPVSVAGDLRDIFGLHIATVPLQPLRGVFEAP